MNYEELMDEIKEAYERSLTMSEAEKLAAKFLYAQASLSSDLSREMLNARMRKTGNKSLRAAVYLDKAQAGEKKPSDVMLEAFVNTDKLVQDDQTELDKSECELERLERIYGIFREAHIYFRGIARNGNTVL